MLWSFHRNASDAVPSLESEAETSSALAISSSTINGDRVDQESFVLGDLKIVEFFFFDRTEVLIEQKLPFVHMICL